MSTFKDEVLKVVGDERVTFSGRIDIPLSDEYGYSAYHGNERYSPFAWSKDLVFFLEEYDGIDIVRCVPRNPLPDLKAGLIGAKRNGKSKNE